MHSIHTRTLPQYNQNNIASKMILNSNRPFFGNQRNMIVPPTVESASSAYYYYRTTTSKEQKNHHQQTEEDIDTDEMMEVHTLKAIANTIQDETMLEVRKLNCISNTLQRVYRASTRNSLGQEEYYNDSSISNSFDQREGDSVDESIFKEYRHEEEEDDIQRICREATMACLWNIIEHLFDFVEQNDNCKRNTRGSNYETSQSPTSCHPQYEDWISDLHPENVNGNHVVDHRFYVRESEHRMVWNEQMMMNDRMDLVIHPRRSGALASVNTMNQ